jgi:DNA-binding CsgD family transcriptional regulator
VGPRVRGGGPGHAPGRGGPGPRDDPAAWRTPSGSTTGSGAGWASLTDIERATTRLGAEGLTDQQIADQLFISTYTVAFHLRQVFRKLDIRSRVDLARIALEHARAKAAQTP